MILGQRRAGCLGSHCVADPVFHGEALDGTPGPLERPRPAPEEGAGLGVSDAAAVEMRRCQLGSAQALRRREGRAPRAARVCARSGPITSGSTERGPERAMRGRATRARMK